MTNKNHLYSNAAIEFAAVATETSLFFEKAKKFEKNLR